MPIGAPPGYREVFSDDFNQNIPVGSFPSAASDKWSAYPDGTPDTSKNGVYMPSKVVSQHDGVLDINPHTENGVHMAAALLPKVPGATGSEGGQLYGEYQVRFKVTNPMPGYKIAWLLWPDSETWPRDGEIDFPEGSLDGKSGFSAFIHNQNGTSGNDQQQFGFETNVADSQWHTATIDWEPDKTTFSLDGQEVGSTTQQIPDTPMHWVIQTETALNGTVPSDSTSGHIFIDWVKIYQRNATGS